MANTGKTKGPPRPKKGDTIIGLSAEEHARVEEFRRTAGHRNPQAVRDAFGGAAGECAEVGGRRLLPFSLGHFLLLEKIGSPYADGVKKVDEVSNERLTELLFVLTRPAKEGRQALARGQEAWDEAVQDFTDSVPMLDLARLGAAAHRSMAAGFSTVLGNEGGEKKSSKTESTPPAEGMDSAGA